MTEQQREGILVELRYMREDLDEIKAALIAQPQTYVTRGEWLLRNEHVNAVLSQVKHELNSKRVPWPAVASLGVAVLAIIITLAQNL